MAVPANESGKQSFTLRDGRTNAMGAAGGARLAVVGGCRRRAGTVDSPCLVGRFFAETRIERRRRQEAAGWRDPQRGKSAIRNPQSAFRNRGTCPATVKCDG